MAGGSAADLVCANVRHRLVRYEALHNVGFDWTHVMKRVMKFITARYEARYEVHNAAL